MKKLILLILLVSGGLYTVKAQITGGGTEKSEPAAAAVQKKAVFKNSFYITFAKATAKGDFAKEVLNQADIEGGNGGMSKGYGLNIGQVFYFNKLDLAKIGLPDNLKVGLDVTYLSGLACFAPNPEGTSGLSQDFRTIFSAMKIGPLISYNPIDKLIVDLKITFQPTSANYENTYITGYNTEFGTVEYNNVGSTFFTLRKGFGLYARYKPLVMGFESSWGKMDFISTYDDAAVKLKSNRFDFVLGFAF